MDDRVLRAEGVQRALGSVSRRLGAFIASNNFMKDVIPRPAARLVTLQKRVRRDARGRADSLSQGEGGLAVTHTARRLHLLLFSLLPTQPPPQHFHLTFGLLLVSRGESWTRVYVFIRLLTHGAAPFMVDCHVRSSITPLDKPPPLIDSDG